MNYWLRRLEKFIDRLIWPALIIIILILVLEFGFADFANKYHLYIEIADVFVILIFLIDLIFKWHHMKNVNLFMRTYWLEIIAVFPFFVLFRFLAGFMDIFRTISEIGGTTQQVIHGGLELEREGAMIAREVSAGLQESAKLQEASNATRFQRFLRAIFRTPRLLKASEFYHHPNT